MRYCLILILTGVLSLGLLQGDATSTTVSYTHVLSWGPPQSREDFLRKTEVFWDGKNIGFPPKAYWYLQKLSLGPKDHIKIEIPDGTLMTGKFAAPPYWCAAFVKIWDANQVKVSYFQGGKSLAVHNVTWVPYMDDDGRQWKDSYDPVHLVLDGKDLGIVSEGVKKMESMTWKPDEIIQILMPYKSGFPSGFMGKPYELDIALHELQQRYGITHILITPLH